MNDDPGQLAIRVCKVLDVILSERANPGFESELYEMVHLGADPSCKDVHGDWREKFEKLYAEMNSRGQFDTAHQTTA
jgi:hypothetical protein